MKLRIIGEQRKSLEFKVVKAMESDKMKESILSPDSSLRVEGSVILVDGIRRITLKRPMRDRFKSLDERDKAICYVMEHYMDKDRFYERIEESMEEGVLPVLLWLREG